MTGRNLTDGEKRYREGLNALIGGIDSSVIAAAPFLFSSRVAVQSLITRYEMYRRILDVPGNIIECGVYKGNSFAFLAHLSVILEPFAINRQLIGFDTFAGFRSITSGADPEDVSSTTFGDTSKQLLEQSLSLIDEIRPVNSVPRFQLVEGDIVETVPDFAAKHPWMTCALLILDTDLYMPTRAALETFLPRMSPGAIIVFDEFNYSNFSGESLAIREFKEVTGMRLRKLPYESCSAFVVLE